MRTNTFVHAFLLITAYVSATAAQPQTTAPAPADSEKSKAPAATSSKSDKSDEGEDIEEVENEEDDEQTKHHDASSSPARSPSAPPPTAEIEDAEDADATDEDASQGDADATDEDASQGDEAETADGDEGSEADEDKVDTKKAPPAGKGAIVGKITDPRTSEPLIDAQVTITNTSTNAKFEGVTDLEGYYRLDLPPGVYTFRVFYEAYKPLRFDRIPVERGKIQVLDAPLEQDAAQVAEEEVVVEAELAQSSVEGQILKRQRSAQASDAIGRAEIAKTPDTNAAQAAQRVVGANIVDGRFVYVRGLGERYTNGLLNGTSLPSPEPDRAAVPLDLFPTQVLESVTISKTFTPDMPGDFAGGSVNVVTRDIPDQLVFSASATGGIRLGTTFRDGNDYRGSSTDFLGFDNGMRGLPGSVPRNYRLGSSDTRLNGDAITERERTEAGRDMNTYMTTQRRKTLPDHGFNFVLGNGWSLGGKRKLGAIGSVNYSRSFLNREETRRDFTLSPDSPSGKVAAVDYKSTLGRESVRLGAYGSLAYVPAENHELRFIGMFSQLSDDDAVTYGGFNVGRAANVQASRLKFVERNLTYGQLSGKHRFPGRYAAELAWNGSLSQAQRNEPDTRDVVYNYNAVRNRWAYVDGSESGRHVWANQSELARVMGLDYTQSLGAGDNAPKFKLGALANLKDRDFRARRFALRPTPIAPGATSPTSCPGETLQNGCIDALFTPDNITGSQTSSSGALYLNEATRGSDSYDAKLNVYSAYVLADVSLSKRLRAIVGERVEVTRQRVTPANPLSIREEIPSAKLNSTDLLPSATAVYQLSGKNNLRSTVSRTLARPQLRELAPFTYTNYFGGLEEQGNPELKLTRVLNADLRWEYFPSLREIVALSLFYKRFNDPIEPIILPGADKGVVSFANSEKANLLGAELETRKELAFIARQLKGVGLLANLTLAWSRISVDQTGKDFITNTRRPLVHQAPWVVNLGVDYASEALGFDTRLLYNVTGPRIAEVGTEGLDDRYVQPRHIVDLVLTKKFAKHVSLRAIAADILSSHSLVTQGRKYRREDVTSRWVDGARFSLAATYNY